jgi:hypothetical protein
MLQNAFFELVGIFSNEVSYRNSYHLFLKFNIVLLGCRKLESTYIELMVVGSYHDGRGFAFEGAG